MIGKTIGNYKIVSILGEGGMGTVFKALDVKLERYVALKILKPLSGQSMQFIERFKREARNQAKLNHANITQVYDFVDERGTLGIAMELVDGETLEQIVQRKTRLEWQEAVKIIIQVLQGIGYAHKMGFIHRDIKPSNVIINADGVVKIMDFGISKSMFEKGITKTGTKIGTILYMSPEQINAEEPTRQSDIYSVGITLYEMLVGITPFEYPTEYEIMEGHLKKSVPKISNLVPNIPPMFDKLIAMAVAKDPQKRFPSCEDFIKALRGLSPSKADVLFDEKEEDNDLSERHLMTGSPKQRIKLVFFTVLIIGVFCTVGYVLYDNLKNIWPDVHRSTTKNTDTTASSERNPAYFEKSDWVEISVDTRSTLMSLYFYNDSLGFCVGERGTLLRTLNGGSSWDVMAFPDTSRYDSLNLYSVEFVTARTGFITGDKGTIYQSVDGGFSWALIDSSGGGGLRDIYFFDEQKGIAVGGGGVIRSTTDGGRTWTAAESKTSELLYSIGFLDMNKGFAVGWAGTLLRTEDGGKTWEQVTPFTTTYLTDVKFNAQGIGFLCGGNGELYRSEDGGDQWVRIKTAISAGLYSIGFIDNENVFAVSHSGTILSSADAGKTWAESSAGKKSKFYRIVVTPDGSSAFLCGTGGTLLHFSKPDSKRNPFNF